MAESMFDSSNVGVGKGRAGGYSLIAKAGTDPTKFEDMTKTLADFITGSSKVEGAKSGGYIDEDGVTKTTDTDNEQFKDWSGTVFRTSLTSYSESVQVGFLESRESVLGAVYGEDNVSTEGGVTTIRHNSNFTSSHVYVFDCVVSDTKVKRTIIPYGVILERDDVEENSSDLIVYKPTITCLPYEGYSGDTMRELLYDVTTGVTSLVSDGEGSAVSD